jgi:hypothetical protein
VLREILGLRPSEMAMTGGAVFAYLFHRIDQRELIQFVGDKEKEERILDVVRRKGYVLRDCKLYAWAAYRSRFGYPKPNIKDYGIDREDAAFLSKLNLNHLSSNFEAYTLEDFKALVEGTVKSPAMDAHIGKFISKKLLFLTRSYGVKRSDLESDMQAAALRAVYMHYPRFETLLHFTNVAKSAIHNTGISLITYYTSPARQRLFVNQNGAFEASHVSVDHVSSLEAPPSYMQHTKESLEVLANLSEKIRPDVQRFLLCCAGHYDEGFSDFLESDNSLAVEAMAYSRYVTKARKYFNFTEVQVNHLFQKLRLHLT